MEDFKMSIKGLNVKRTWGSCKKIDSLIKKEKDARIKERLQAVLWRLENEDYTKIAKRLKRHIDTVCKLQSKNVPLAGEKVYHLKSK